MLSRFMALSLLTNLILLSRACSRKPRSAGNRIERFGCTHPGQRTGTGEGAGQMGLYDFMRADYVADINTSLEEASCAGFYAEHGFKNPVSRYFTGVITSPLER